jgi:hypothetical protein
MTTEATPSVDRVIEQACSIGRGPVVGRSRWVVEAWVVPEASRKQDSLGPDPGCALVVAGADTPWFPRKSKRPPVAAYDSQPRTSGDRYVFAGSVRVSESCSRRMWSSVGGREGAVAAKIAWTFGFVVWTISPVFRAHSRNDPKNDN